jgi:eukaryotic-like serine/threonine-protein kinase
MAQLIPGAEVGSRYRIVRRVGEGGMGEVWEAVEGSDGGRVALKFIKHADTREARGRLLREARAAGAVRHPNVVTVVDVIEHDDGSPVIVMEYLEGESLAAKLRRDGELELEEAASILLPVVSAVGAAHALGIVHRDLKPENIFLLQAEGTTPDVRVLDFGLAKMVLGKQSTSDTALTSTGSMLGTPCYMAPEQVFAERDVDHRADLWAIGLVLYRALTGILPTQAENVGQVMKLIVTRPIWSLRQAAPDLPRDVTDLVDRLLARDVSERPPDLRPVYDVLTRYARASSPPFGAPPSTRPSDVGDAGVSAVPRSVDVAPAGAAPARPGRVWRIAAAVVALATVAGLAWGLRQGDESNDGKLVAMPIVPAASAVQVAPAIGDEIGVAKPHDAGDGPAAAEPDPSPARPDGQKPLAGRGVPPATAATGAASADAFPATSATAPATAATDEPGPGGVVTKAPY